MSNSFATPWIVAHQASLSMGFPRKEYHFLLRGSSQPRGWTPISCAGKQILYHWATREAPWVLILFKRRNMGLNLHLPESSLLSPCSPLPGAPSLPSRSCLYISFLPKTHFPVLGDLSLSLSPGGLSELDTVHYSKRIRRMYMKYTIISLKHM